MGDESLQSAVGAVAAGAWAVGVSGGADSVALLSLLRRRADLRLHVAHLDHQTRAAESAGDAGFVAELARGWGVGCTVARRDEVEPALAERPANASALYRALRLALFRRVVREHGLRGVVLAHHADDQAETVLQRLLRGSGPAGLVGMEVEANIGGLTVVRPLLGVPREALRDHLRHEGLAWREDASNASDDYLRNRLRKILAARPGLAGRLVGLSRELAELRAWVRAAAPALADSFPPAELAGLPAVLADESARRWLARQGVPEGELSGEVVGRLVRMADPAGPPRRDFPGGVRVRRRAKRLSAERGGR